jgi:hypothetical protein
MNQMNLMNRTWHLTDALAMSLNEYSLFCKIKPLPAEGSEELLKAIAAKEHFSDFEHTTEEEEKYPEPGDTIFVPTKCPIEGGNWKCESISPKLYENLGIELAHAPKEVASSFFKYGEIVAINPEKKMTFEHDFREAVLAMHQMPDVPIEVDAELYEYFLNVLPPFACHVRLEYPEIIRKLLPDCPQYRAVEYITGEGDHKGGFRSGEQYYMLGISKNVIVKRPGDKDKTADQLYFSHTL